MSRFLDDQITYYYVKYQLFPPSALKLKNARKCTISEGAVPRSSSFLKIMYFSSVALKDGTFP